MSSHDESESDSVTIWLNQLKQGEREVATCLWERYCHQLSAVARKRFGNAPRRVSDEDDVVQSVFLSFCRGAEEGRFPKLEDRTDLWQVLLLLTRDKVAGEIRRQFRKKRGGGEVRGESVFQQPGETPGQAFDGVTGEGPTPDDLVAFTDHLRQLLDALTSEQRQIAVLRMQGHSVVEIADTLNLSLRSVERKLGQVRGKWDAALDLPGT